MISLLSTPGRFSAAADLIDREPAMRAPTASLNSQAVWSLDRMKPRVDSTQIVPWNGVSPLEEPGRL